LQAYDLGLNFRLLGPDKDEVLLYILDVARKYGYDKIPRHLLAMLIFKLKSETKIPIKYKVKADTYQSDSLELDLLDLFAAGFVREYLDFQTGPKYELTSFGASYVDSYISQRLGMFEKVIADELPRSLTGT
jgi:hypothetical protein